MNRFFSGNFGDQKGVAQYRQSAERKKLPTQNTLPGKVVLQQWRRDCFSD